MSSIFPGFPFPFEEPEILGGAIAVQVIIADETLLWTITSGDSPLQTNVSRVETSKFAEGEIVTIKSVTEGGQLGSKSAVTVIVPTTGLPVLLAGVVQVGTCPFPEAPIPIEVLLLVHV